MKVRIGNRVASLDPKKLLGQGGEACVYRWRDRAVKIFHDTSPAALAPKLARLDAFPRGLPSALLAPEQIVTDLDDRPVGFTMARVPNAEDLKRLGQRRFRDGVIPNREVSRLFAELHQLLTRLHQRGVVVGDLNDANVLFTRSEGACHPWLIDADSMQFGDHLCPVAHPLFLDPKLLGVDFATTRAFDANSDWYAFSTLLFASLLYLHPYGGVHPDYPTLMRRAEARHSVLRPDVTRPKAAADPRCLPDELGAWFEAVFDRGLRDVFPPRLLANSRWTLCSCGTEHARLACPACAARGTIVVRPPVIQTGRCRAQRIYAGPGRVLAAARAGELRYLVVDDQQRLRREDGSTVASLRVEPGMRFGLLGRSTFIGHRGQLLELRDGKLLGKHNVASFANTPVFDSSHDRCLFLDDQWLTDAHSGQRLATLFEGQTWFRLGPALGYGFFRASAVTVHFTFRPGEPGIKEIALPPISGRLLDVDACFDDRRALVSMSTETGGATTTALYLLGSDGALLASASGPAEASPLLVPGTRFAMLGGHVVAATEEGLMSVKNDHGILAADQTFVDTEPFVAEGARILPGPGGSVYVIHPREIFQLSLS